MSSSESITSMASSVVTTSFNLGGLDLTAAPSLGIDINIGLAPFHVISGERQ